MDCGATLVKYVLFIFNVLILICGILLITFGSFIITNMGEIKNFSDANDFSIIPIFIIALGCIVFVISFVGCCGAIRENTCLTMTYSVIMLILLVLQVIVVAFVWTHQDSFIKAMEKVVNEAWKEHNKDRSLMDVLEISFKCCGKDSVTDYVLSGEAIPNACCGKLDDSCSKVSALLRPGCSRAFKDFWSVNIRIIEYAGLVIAAVELTAFIFGCCIANQFRNERRRAAY